ncbi:EAL domain-containing protein [Paenibacillus caui]|uniref:sensor domain-containing protein n=1 Tax=Paenibacillus caui TaxID=2873927 RepID=UPI001CA95E75|nr:EAL domain-containing protein [Paenibacillus caui]
MTPCSMNHSMEAETEKLKILLECSTDAIFWMSSEGMILDVNAAIVDISGYEADYFVNRPFGHFFKGQKLNERNKAKVKLRHQQGHEVGLHMTIVPVVVEGNIIGVLAICRPSSPERLQEEVLLRQIRQMTYYDSLTGLPNLNKFKEIWGRFQSDPEAAKIPRAILLFDMDRFRVVNHYAGYERGNDFMVAVAKRLSSDIRQEDIVFRWTSDRFLILLHNVTRAQTKQILERILHQFQIPLVVKQMECVITPSIGVGLFPEDGTDADTLMNKASIAMHFTKSSGKNSYRFYNNKMDTGSSPIMEQQLRKALVNKEFVLYYQPKVDIFTGITTGVEALVRWNHPEYGVIPPSKFIPLAEESGLIVPLGTWVLETACAQNKAWQEAGLSPMVVSVNLSPHQFKHGNIVAAVEGALVKSGLAPHFLEVEITESMMLDVNYAIETLTKLKKLGVHTSLDDFGKGYSSLAYLKSLPIDILKVDSSFIKNCTEDHHDAALLKTIVNMGHNLEMTVVAEGVEAAEQLDLLREYACHQAKGYLLSKPVPASDMLATLTNISRRFQM